MTNFEKEKAINYLISKGINFEKNVFELSDFSNSILHDTAKKCRWKPAPNNSCLSGILYARFFLYLQKYYYKNKALFA